MEDVLDSRFFFEFANALGTQFPQLKTLLTKLSEGVTPRVARRAKIPGYEPRQLTINGQNFWVNLTTKDFELLSMFIDRYHQNPESPLSLDSDTIRKFYGEDSDSSVVSRAKKRLNLELSRATRSADAPKEAEFPLAQIVGDDIAMGPAPPRRFQETKPTSQLRTRHGMVNGQGGLYHLEIFPQALQAP